jgi:hypothetical protein
MPNRISKKVTDLLKEHKAEVIEDLGASAFDLLTPQETAALAGVEETKRLPELIRQGWLEPAPGKDIGTAHQYYRWRAEFVRQYKKSINRKKVASSN